MSPPLLVEASRLNWTASEQPTIEQIDCGSFQRIAAGVEAMAKGHVELAKSRDYWKDEAERRGAELSYLVRSNAALRGVVTKLKALTPKKGFSRPSQKRRGAR